MVRIGRIVTIVATSTILLAAALPAGAQSTDPTPDNTSVTPSPVEPTATTSPDPESTDPTQSSDPTRSDDSPSPDPKSTPTSPAPSPSTAPDPEPDPEPEPSAPPAPEDIPTSGLQVARGGMTDSELALLQERVAELQAQLDELAAEETDAERAAARARDELAAADQAAVQAAEKLMSANEAAQAADDDVAASEDELADARRRVELAEDALTQADDDIAAARKVMHLRIRELYIGGGHLSQSELVLGVDDINMVLRVAHMVEAAVDQDVATVDALALAKSVRQDRLAAASAAQAAAETVEVRVAEAQQRAEDAQHRATEAALEADRTAERLRRQSEQLTEESERVSEPRLELETRLQAARSALEAALSGGSGNGEATGDLGLVTVWADRGDGVLVGGITVSVLIGQQLQDLLEAAAADGVVLGGSGYRTPKTTERLRQVNGCPDIYTSPASTCRVPTAIPGRSMHERGLAVDFSYQGRTLCFPTGPRSCRGNPGFDWLADNAARFGLKGSSVEAWHWSTNGN